MLEITAELASRTFYLDRLGLHFDLHLVGDVHGLEGQDGLHFLMRVVEQRPGERKTKTLGEYGGQRRSQNPNVMFL